MELEFDICQTNLWNQIFSFLKIIKPYYKNGDSASGTYRALRGDYGLHNPPITQVIGKIVKIFEETGVVTNIVRPMHHRFPRSAENIAIVS